MAAASEGCEEIAELLLEKGSDMVKRNHVSKSIERTCLATVFCVVIGG